MAFVSGLGLGLLALPLAFLCGSVLGGGSAGVLVFVALVAGAATLPPVSGKRIAGVATGIAVELAAAFVFVASVLSGARFG